MKKELMLIISIVILAFIGYSFIRPLMHNPKGKVKILMAGRSTMSLWFKHWNWPYPLRIKTTYKPWPIAYEKYSYNGLFFEYLPMAGPKSKDAGVPFGENMLKSFEKGLDQNRYDAAFFKFCFVDFPVKPDEDWKQRLLELTNTIQYAHGMTARRKMKLIIGNALPLPDPNEDTLRLQREYNSWLQEYADTNQDVMVFDLFGPLTYKDGKFRMELAHAKDDHHPGEKAFALLDKTFFVEIESWLKQ